MAGATAGRSRAFRLLDVAGGTGDVALKVTRARRAWHDRGNLSDISPEMLAVGQRKVWRRGSVIASDASRGNAEALPFPDKSFNAYTIAFGIRNVTRIDRALFGGLPRASGPGGRFLCLEFSHVDVPMLDRLYDFHSFEVIPRLGQLAAGGGEPYDPSSRASASFRSRSNSPDRSGRPASRAAFHRNLTRGIAAIIGVADLINRQAVFTETRLAHPAPSSTSCTSSTSIRSGTGPARPR